MAPRGQPLGGRLVDLEALVADLGGLNLSPRHLLELPDPAAGKAGQRRYLEEED